MQGANTDAHETHPKETDRTQARQENNRRPRPAVRVNDFETLLLII
jgi:hypothetical protein